MEHAGEKESDQAPTGVGNYASSQGNHGHAGRQWALYSLLELQADATTEEIRLAYRRLVRQTHPDKNTSKDAHREFQDLKEAYDILSDPQTRVMYDALGDETFWELHRKGTAPLSVHHAVWVLSRDWFFGLCTAPFDTISVISKVNFGTTRATGLGAIRFGGSALWAGEVYRIAKGVIHTQVENRLANHLNFSAPTCAILALIVAYPLEVFQTVAQAQAAPADESMFGLTKRLIELGGVRALYSGIIPWMCQYAALIKAGQFIETNSLFSSLSGGIRRFFGLSETRVREPGRPPRSPIREMVAGLTITVLKVAAVWAIVTPVKTIAVRSQTATLRGSPNLFWTSNALERAGGIRSLYSGYLGDVGYQLASMFAGGLMGSP